MYKKLLFILPYVLLCTLAHAQLPPAAQILYDSAYAQDPNLITYASNNGAQVMATPDGNSFYVQWFPVGADPDSTPVIVTLHGSQCNAFMEFQSWFPQAQLHGCGIISFQWYRYVQSPPNDYFADSTLYMYIDSALSNISYPSNKALLHGFSRGSARSYAMIFLDIQSGNNYFCTTISNAGDANLGYPLYNDIDNGVYGSNVFAGKRWNLFCGGQDQIVGCGPMNATETWLQGQGAIVDIFIQDPALDHDGFQLQSSFAYKDSILNKYLECYNGTSDVNDVISESDVRIFPNPSSGKFTISNMTPTSQVTITDIAGRVLIQTTSKEIDLSGYGVGMYFLTFDTDSGTVTRPIVID
jgi:hypothetical protein